MTEPAQGLSLHPECRVRTLSLSSLGTDLISALFVSVSSGRVMLTTADPNLLGSNKTFDSAPLSVRLTRCRLGSVSVCLCTAGGLRGKLDSASNLPPKTQNSLCIIVLDLNNVQSVTVNPITSALKTCRFTQSAVWDFHSALVLLRIQVLHLSELKIIKCQKRFTKLNVLPLSLHEVTALCVFRLCNRIGKSYSTRRLLALVWIKGWVWDFWNLSCHPAPPPPEKTCINHLDPLFISNKSTYVHPPYLFFIPTPRFFPSILPSSNPKPFQMRFVTSRCLFSFSYCKLKHHRKWPPLFQHPLWALYQMDVRKKSNRLGFRHFLHDQYFFNFFLLSCSISSSSFYN